MGKQQFRSFPFSLKSANFSTVLSISLVLFVLGFMLVMTFFALNATTSLKENVSFTIYLTNDAKEEGIEELKSELKKHNFVKEIEYVDKEKAAKMMNEIMGEAHLNVLDSINPYLASFVVNFKAQSLKNSNIQGFIRDVESNEIVDSIDYRKELVNQINDTVYKIIIFLSFFILCLLVIAITLINHTIKLTIYAKRFLIYSMELVGAKRWLIRRPFILRGFVFGLIGAIAANILLAGVLYWIHTSFMPLLEIQNLIIFAFVAILIFLFGIILSLTCTSMSMTRFKHIKKDRLYY